jgi:hypothetical protein
MNSETKGEIKRLLLEKLNKKLEAHKTETEYKPFFDAIFSKKQIITASVIHSFYTSFGMSIYEQIGEILAKSQGYEAERQYELLGSIDNNTENLINKIVRDLIDKKILANLDAEIDLIKSSIKPSKPLQKDNDRTVDLFIKKGKEEYYFDLKTVKPNKTDFESFKRKLLRWIGLRLSQSKDAKLNVAIAMPYNPYYPKRYVRFGSDTLFDKTQLLVQDDFWNLLGGKGTFQELIKIHQEVGNVLRDKIDKI